MIPDEYDNGSDDDLYDEGEEPPGPFFRTVEWGAAIVSISVRCPAAPQPDYPPATYNQVFVTTEFRSALDDGPDGDMAFGTLSLLLPETTPHPALPWPWIAVFLSGHLPQSCWPWFLEKEFLDLGASVPNLMSCPIGQLHIDISVKFKKERVEDATQWKDAYMVYKLPSLRRYTKSSNDDEVLPCALCTKELRQGDAAAVMECKHTFHDACLCHWLLEAKACPCCDHSICQRYDVSMK